MFLRALSDKVFFCTDNSNTDHFYGPYTKNECKSLKMTLEMHWKTSFFHECKYTYQPARQLREQATLILPRFSKGFLAQHEGGSARATARSKSARTFQGGQVGEGSFRVPPHLSWQKTMFLRTLSGKVFFAPTAPKLIIFMDPTLKMSEK